MLPVGTFETYRPTPATSVYGIDRKRSAGGQNDAIDPTETWGPVTLLGYLYAISHSPPASQGARL